MLRITATTTMHAKVILGMGPHIPQPELTVTHTPTLMVAPARTPCILPSAIAATWPILLQLARTTIGTAQITRPREHTPMTTANRVPAATMWTRCI